MKPYTPSTILPPLEGTTKFGGTQSRIIMGGVNVQNVGEQLIPCVEIVEEDVLVHQYGVQQTGGVVSRVEDYNTEVFEINKAYSLLNDTTVPVGSVVITGVTGEAITYDENTGVVTGVTVEAFVQGTAYWCRDVITLPNATIYIYESTIAGRNIKEVYDALRQIIAANILKPNLQGITFVEGGATDDAAELAASLEARKKIATIASSRVTDIGTYSFYQCSSLQSVSFPNVTSIGNYAFQGCTALQSVSFPNVTSINQSAFYLCSSLQSVSFPNVTSISAGVFSDCTALQSVSFPNVTSIGATNTFASCRNLIDLEFGKYLANSLSVSSWNPTTALSTTSYSLVPQDIREEHPDWKNKDYLLYNIRRHIAAILPDRTGLSSLTLTFSSAIKNAINDSEETLQMFIDKNWTIA